MDNRHDGDTRCSRRRDTRERPIFAPLPAASQKPVQLELGKPQVSFPSPLGSSHQARREVAARIGEGEKNISQGIVLETSSSLTPLDLHRPPRNRSCQRQGNESTSGVSPSGWTSLFSDFRVPSLDSFGETQTSNSTARSVPSDGSWGSHEDDHPRHSGRLRLGHAEGEQRVPDYNVRSIGSTGTGTGSSSKTRNLFQAQSSQFSNSWPRTVEVQGQGITLTRGGEGGRFVGSDQGSFIAFPQRSKLTAGQRDGVGSSGTSPLTREVPSLAYSIGPIYDPKSSFAFPRVVSGFKGKNKVYDSSEMNLENDRGISGKTLGKSPRCMTSIPAGTRSDVRSPRRGLPDLEGLNMGPVRGDCREFSAKRCSSRKEVNTEDAQPMDIDAEPFSSAKPGDKVGGRQSSEGQKQSGLRNSVAAADAAGPSGLMKRYRQHPVKISPKIRGDDSERVTQGEQANGLKTQKGQTCNWLQRWLQPNSSLLITNVDGRSKVGFSGLGPTEASRSSTENTREEHGQQWNRFQNQLGDFSSKGGLFALSPFSTPSAFAIGIIGNAAECIESPLTQHKDPIMIRPSDTKVLQDKHLECDETHDRRSS